LFESTDFSPSKPIKAVQFNFDMKSSLLSNDIRTTRDSEIKGETVTNHSRKSSSGQQTSSKDKDKKILVGNFMYTSSHSVKSTLKDLRILDLLES
jgi:hypothetical protein